MLGQRDRNSCGQPTLANVENGTSAARTEVKGSTRINPQARVSTPLGNRGHILGGFEHDLHEGGQRLLGFPIVPRFGVFA